MTGVMERIRVTFDIPEPVRRAIAIYAAETNQSVGQVIEQFAGELIPDHISRAEEAIAAGVPKLARKGRPPKKSKPAD